MLCPSCGHENREDATFCGGCGAALAADLVCASCGRSNPPDQIFCDACGQRLTEAAKPDERPAPDETPDSAERPELKETVPSEPEQELPTARADEHQKDTEPDEAPDSAERPELRETVPSEPVEAMAYPATFDAHPPLEFGKGHVALRILVIIVLIFVLALVQIEVNVLIFGGAYLVLPVIAAILISRKGAARYLAEAEAGPTKWLRYIMGFCSYMALATDKVPTKAPEEVVELSVQPNGSPTVSSALLRIILAIPHALILGLLAIVFAVVWLIAAISILRNDGTYPEWVSKFIRGYLRWIARVLAYMASLVDEYPPFPVDPIRPQQRPPTHAEAAAEKPDAERPELNETVPSESVEEASAGPAQGLPAARAQGAEGVLPLPVQAGTGLGGRWSLKKVLRSGWGIAGVTLTVAGSIAGIYYAVQQDQILSEATAPERTIWALLREGDCFMDTDVSEVTATVEVVDCDEADSRVITKLSYRLSAYPGDDQMEDIANQDCPRPTDRFLWAKKLIWDSGSRYIICYARQ